MKKLLTILVIMLGLLVAAPSVANGDDNSPEEGGVAQVYLADTTPLGLFQGEAPHGFVARTEIMVGPDGRAVIQARAGVMDSFWRDPIGRPALEVTVVEEGEFDSSLVIKLEKPKERRGGDERWRLAPLPVFKGKTYPVKFQYRDRITEALPEEFILRPETTVDRLGTTARKTFWVSAGDLVMDGKAGLLAKTAKAYATEFSDFHGKAAKIRKTVNGLFLTTDEVTLGYCKEEQPEDPALFDRSQFMAVTFVENGAESLYLPERLRRYRVCYNDWEESERIWVSQRYLMAYFDRGQNEVRFKLANGALFLPSKTEDEHGEYVELVRGSSNPSKRMRFWVEGYRPGRRLGVGVEDEFLDSIGLAGE